MRLSSGIVVIDQYDVGPIRGTLPAEDDPIWDERSFRQRTLRNQEQTRSIVFEWLENTWRPDQPIETETMRYAPAELSQAVYACADVLLSHRPGTIAKLMLAELAPGAEIPIHCDRSPALVKAHRCHLPILSSEGVRFTVEYDVHFLEPGTVYELDNTRMHSVVNATENRRVHLICDILP